MFTLIREYLVRIHARQRGNIFEILQNSICAQACSLLAQNETYLTALSANINRQTAFVRYKTKSVEITL